VGFPIHWEQPLKLHSFIGLTFPPRAGVLVPKTQILFLQHIPFSLVFAYGIDGQVDCILPYFARLVVVVLESFRYAINLVRLHSSPHFSIHLNTDKAAFGGKLPPKTCRLSTGSV
jgi:hypothetical protein